MKKFKSIIAVFLSMIIVGSLATSLVASANTYDHRFLNAPMEAQKTDYYCGVCAFQSFLAVENRDHPYILPSDVRGYKSQADVVNIIQQYGKYTVPTNGIGWFIGSQHDRPDYRTFNPLCRTLRWMIDISYNWMHYGQYTNTGVYNERVLRTHITQTIDNGHCVLVNGDTKYYDWNRGIWVRKDYCVYSKQNCNDNSRMPYPDTTGHWVIIDGYASHGYVLRVRDSGAGSAYTTGFPASSYYVKLHDLKTFIDGSHGIIYCDNK